jgi:hypothetical protein
VQKPLPQNKASVRAYFERFADMSIADEIFGSAVQSTIRLEISTASRR